MLLGAGIPQRVTVWRMGLARLVASGDRVVNPGARSAWRDGRGCPWRASGVWDLSPAGEPLLLRPDHFTRVSGRSVDFARDYLAPFLRRFADELHEADPRAALFLEGVPSLPPPPFDTAGGPRTAFAPHWYDDLLVVKKRYLRFLGLDSRTRKIVLGPRAVRKCFADQLADLRRQSESIYGGAPILLAEFGVPFDMNRARAYRTGDFRVQARALDRSFRAVEQNLLSCTIWNYTPDNSNRRGDRWNGEDFSIYSADQRGGPEDAGSGGRAVSAFARPYPRATAGEPLLLDFDRARRRFLFEFRHDPKVGSPTEIFVPRLQYPRGYRVWLSDGDCEKAPDRQLLVYRHGGERQTHVIRVSPVP
jgi:hypothetical protein